MTRPLPVARRRQTGVSLAELIVTMAITAALLTAVAVATDASFKAYAINTVLADRTQSCRVAMHRIMTTLRTAREHGPLDSSKSTLFAAGSVVTDTGLQVFDTDGNLIAIRLDATNRRMLMTVDTGAASTEYILLQNVDTFSITFEPMRSEASARSAGSFDLLKQATILLTVGEGDNRADTDESLAGEPVTFSASVVPRQNAW